MGALWPASLVEIATPVLGRDSVSKIIIIIIIAYVGNFKAALICSNIRE